MDSRTGTAPYGTIWLWLMVLLAISIIVAFLPIPKLYIVLLVFTMAAVKAGLVGFHYMHLRVERVFIYVIAITPIILFITLFLALIPDIAYRR